MPKKTPTNAFYYFVIEYKETQKKKGNVIPHADAFKQAGPLWEVLPKADREKYENLAKMEKQRNGVPEKKYTSQGIPISVVQARAAEEKLAQETEVKAIRNLVRLSPEINKKAFYVMDVNYYCEVKGHYVICEMSLIKFNLLDGIVNEYHEMINPGAIPTGYAYDAKTACVDLGVQHPDEKGPVTNYMQILAYITDFLNEAKDTHTQVTLPPIFTRPDKVAAVKDFMLQLCSKGSEDERIFRIYKINLLYFELINAVKTQDDEGLPKESLALAQLDRDLFKYNPGLSCEEHENGEKAVECTMSRVKRWAFTILDHCCPIANIGLVPGHHVPADYNLDRITAFTDEITEKKRNTVAGLRALEYSYDMNSTGETSSALESSSAFESSFSSSIRRPDTRNRSGDEGVRRPKIDYSESIRKAPGLSKVSRAPGVGRGRPLSSSLNQMNIN